MFLFFQIFFYISLFHYISQKGLTNFFFSFITKRVFELIHYNFFVWKMDQHMPLASQIRANRLKIKQSLKIKIKKDQNIPSNISCEPATQETACTRRRKKTSECLKEFDTLSIFKDVAIKQEFEDFFIRKEKLGQGAHSVVYRCQQKSTHKEFAVKITKRNDLQLMENMRECYQILKQFDHQSIIKGHYLYMNEKKFTCHLVEELCQYDSLQYFLMKQRRNKHEGLGISEKLVANICQQLLSCVSYIHDKGACHRDIKPDNILYDPVQGRIKLIDFELAKMERYTNEKLQLWSRTGTLNYKAPQIYKGGYNESVDIWAVGIVAYEMLVGSLPFKSSYNAETIDKIRNEEINYETLTISKSAKFFLKNLLEKNPQKRMTAKEALSCPFIMRSTRNSIPKLVRLKSLHISNKQLKKQKNHYYDENVESRFITTSGSDIGVRICGQKLIKID